MNDDPLERLKKRTPNKYGRYVIELVYVPGRLDQGDEPWEAYVAGEELLHFHAWSPEDAYRGIARMIHQK